MFRTCSERPERSERSEQNACSEQPLKSVKIYENLLKSMRIHGKYIKINENQ